MDTAETNHERGSVISLVVAVLGSLDRHGPCTVGELAHLERVKPPSMTRIVNSLVELGLTVRRAHEADGRQVIVDLTDAARALLAEDRRRREAWLARRIAELGEDDIEFYEVTPDDEDQGVAARVHRGVDDGVVHRVGAREAAFKRHAQRLGPGLEAVQHALGVGLGAGRRGDEQAGHRVPDGFIGEVAIGELSAVAPGRDMAVRPCGEQGIGRGLDERLKHGRDHGCTRESRNPRAHRRDRASV